MAILLGLAGTIITILECASFLLFFVESNFCGCHSHGFSKVWSVDKSTNTQYNSVHHNIFVNDKLFQSI